jgi:ABC-type polysaccharide transport system permease subunit
MIASSREGTGSTLNLKIPDQLQKLIVPNFYQLLLSPVIFSARILSVVAYHRTGLRGRISVALALSLLKSIISEVLVSITYVIVLFSI